MRAINLVLMILVATPATAGWRDMLDNAGKTLNGNDSASGSVAAGALSNGEIATGLKEALGQGAAAAVSSLGRTDGFLGNPDVRIPLPGPLEGIGNTLRTMGQSQLVDSLVNTMNRAAEAAVPEAAELFKNAISQMTLDDARGILQGPDDAATRYLQRASGDQLKTRMAPIVQRATASAGVTSAYKGMLSQAGPMGSMLGNTVNLDSYVTQKATDGLFLMVAREEARIRANPVARSTDVLRKVFGGAGP